MMWSEHRVYIKVDDFLPMYKTEAKISYLWLLPSCANGIIWSLRTTYQVVNQPIHMLQSKHLLFMAPIN